MDVMCGLPVNVTVVANDFIDRYMAAANGEYVKVYLYVLRHQSEAVSLERIADSLNHTEADVRRALLYWEKLGALKLGADSGRREAAAETAAGQRAQMPGRTPGQMSGQFSGQMRGQLSSQMSGQLSGQMPGQASGQLSGQTAPAGGAAEPRRKYTPDQVNAMAADEDFTQLLYIAQKYLNKVFTQRECEVFAYLYDGLGLSAELLEYLTEYCAQTGHTSIRYLETVAVSWHERGIRTVEEAKSWTAGFGKDVFAVMKAFGLGDRRPGDGELEQIMKWFRGYGFGRELVLEACGRTLAAIHTPSFAYADKILSQWKEAGVKSLQDVAEQDRKRQTQPGRGRETKRPANQFHNFEQRNTDYDSMVLDQVKTWISAE